MPVIERRLSHPHCQKNVDCAMVVMTAASCVHVYVYIKHASLCVYHFPANECILPEAIAVNEHPQVRPHTKSGFVQSGNDSSPGARHRRARYIQMRSCND